MTSPLKDHTLALPEQPTARAKASMRPWPWCLSSHHSNECNNDLDKQLLTAALCRVLFRLAPLWEEDASLAEREKGHDASFQFRADGREKEKMKRRNGAESEALKKGSIKMRGAPRAESPSLHWAEGRDRGRERRETRGGRGH